MDRGSGRAGRICPGNVEKPTAIHQSAAHSPRRIGPMGTPALFFFRHDDRSWRVYPPETERPAMAPRL
ncbi:hypothetical protein DIE06_23735 [Burkholderia sp. Bp8998]|nr:hypothetical protein DIE06_23735 [Burkholderia sp. Bp8998]